MTTCTICGQQIPVDELQEHMRIELLDPKWKSQRDALEARKAQASEPQRGANVVSSLKNLARTRVDIFGAEADEEKRKKEEEEERLRRAKEEAEIKKVEEIEGQPEVPPAEEETKSDGKLIVAEEVEEGHISWKALKLYLAGLGGNHPMLFFIACIGGILITESFGAFETWYLGYWAGKYEEAADPRDVNVFS